MQRQFRMRSAIDFERVRREGRSYHHSLMVVSVAANQLTSNRYGIITSKRVGKAVQRNRVRRVLRAALRCLESDSAAGFDVVVIAKGAMVGVDFDTIVKVLDELFRKAFDNNHNKKDLHS